MAERRMFSKSVICSDDFITLPYEAQTLYFHLCIHADDDGFVNKPLTIMRMVAASQDSLDLLIEKEFLIVLETGVMLVTHWHINNQIRRDRYRPTLFTYEATLVALDINDIYYVLDSPKSSKIHLPPEGIRKTPRAIPDEPEDSVQKRTMKIGNEEFVIRPRVPGR